MSPLMPVAVVGPALALGYATTLPASPQDGQESILVDSITNPTYQWRFRYNAGSASAYKWECVGGSPKLTANTAQEATTSMNAWTDLASITPTFTFPRSGEYVVQASASITHGTAAVAEYIGIALGAISPIDQQTVNVAVANNFLDLYLPTLATVVASDVARIRYFFATGSGTGTGINRQLSVVPVRVS